MRKRLLWIGLILLVVLAVGGGWWWVRASLPLLDGEIRLAGLVQPVEILSDAAGVPHIYARDPDDAWFAAGAVHARDRLWQMELYRRVTRGRLSEVLGETTLPIDQRLISLGLREAADAEWQRATPEVKLALERYAAGVNAYVQTLTLGRQRPLEMQLLGITPAPWTPVDSLAVGRLLAWRLAENHQSELVRAALASKLGAEAARQLAGRYPSDAPTVLSPPERSEGPTARSAAPPERSEGPTVRSAAPPERSEGPTVRSAAPDWPSGLEWLDPMAKRGNSNNWVVAGSKTASGRPILANDPHLQIEFPSIWYELHLVAAGLDVIGVTVPGVPFILIGHNQRVAWGFTNSGADVQDLYLERLDVARKRYQGPGGWQPADVTRVEIPIRGRETPAQFDVWRTPHGPIYAGPSPDWKAPPAWMSPDAPPETSSEGASGRVADTVSAYALRWEAVAGDIAGSFERLNRVSDWPGFLAAVEGFAIPSQNIVYADVDGNIGYAVNGRVPLRASGDGTFPVDGASGGGAWTGVVDAASMPRILNPPAAYITSSNNEIERRSGVLITRDWAGPSRARRLHEVLSAGTGLTIESMEALQNDRTSVSAERVLAGVPGALAAAKARNADPVVIDALTRLGQWDRIVDARPVVTLYQAFEHAIWRRTFMDDMDETLFESFYEWAGGDRPAGLYTIVDDRQSRWFDDIGTVETRETRDEIYVLAARDASERVRAELGSESNQAWDRVHAARFAHPIGNAARPLAWIFDGGTSPIQGDGSTVMRVSWNRRAPFQAFEVPSWRQILDVGQWDNSRVILPTGQGSHLMSPYRFDQNERWRTGQYRIQPFSRAAVDAAKAHRQLLSP